MLREIKTKTEHYFVDENGLWQGEYTKWYEREWYECLFRKKRKIKAHRFYINGLLHGECKHYHDNGRLSSDCVYINGNMHGEYKSWLSNGRIFERYLCVDGEPHGEYQLFYQDGRLRNHCFYIDGERVYFDIIPYPETEEDRMYLMLKYNLQLLPVENI